MSNGTTYKTELYCPVCGTRGLIDCGKALMEMKEILDCLSCGMRITLPVEAFDGITSKSVQSRT